MAYAFALWLCALNGCGFCVACVWALSLYAAPRAIGNLVFGAIEMWHNFTPAHNLCVLPP